MHANQERECEREIVGLIPAAGQAARIAPLPCSKELYPVGFKVDEEGRRSSPKVVCQYLLEKMRLAGITKAYIVLRPGKWDIPDYLGDGIIVDMRLAYLMMGLPFGVPYTIDQAYPFLQDAVVAFGFPDMLFEPDDVFLQLLNRQTASSADIVLGIFPADRPQKVDMVDLDDDWRIRRIVIKPRQTDLNYTWGIAVWTPIFTHFMHDYLSVAKQSAETQPELFMGDVVQAAILEGLHVEAVQVSNEPFLDIGTGDDLARAVNRFLTKSE